MKTFSAKSETVRRDWFLINADGKILGRLASEIARRLRGKHKPEYTPHVDTGDYLIVINVEKIAVTGNKKEGKIYYRHSGYPGGLKTRRLKDQQQKSPTSILEIAVKGMLPKNILGREMFRKLKVYVGDQHPHSSQQPQLLELSDI